MKIKIEKITILINIFTSKTQEKIPTFFRERMTNSIAKTAIEFFLIYFLQFIFLLLLKNISIFISFAKCVLEFLVAWDLFRNKNKCKEQE